MQLADFETVKQFVDTAMQGDPATTVMSGGELYSNLRKNALTSRGENGLLLTSGTQDCAQPLIVVKTVDGVKS